MAEARRRNPTPPDLLQGTLEVMVLRTLDRGDSHGYGIARSIERAGNGDLAVEEGSLYPALYRLEKRGDIAGTWRVTEGNRRARYYRLTPRGKERLRDQMSLWLRLSTAVNRVLAVDPATAGEAAR